MRGLNHYGLGTEPLNLRVMAAFTELVLGPTGRDSERHSLTRMATAASVTSPEAPVIGQPIRTLLFTAALAVQCPPKDHQRYCRNDAERYRQREQLKPEEYPCDEDAENHGDGGNPGV